MVEQRVGVWIGSTAQGFETIIVHLSLHDDVDSTGPQKSERPNGRLLLLLRSRLSLFLLALSVLLLTLITIITTTMAITIVFPEGN